MEPNFLSRALFFFLLLAISSSFSSASFISNGVLESEAMVSGRNMLQTREKPCRVNFEVMNYTAMTRRCRGPRYPARACCAAFKDFACPFTEAINDLNTDCAIAMFSFINLYGNYPPGLFANNCKEGKEGLECPET